MPLTSTHWGTYHTEVRDGQLVGMQPFGQDADPSDIGKGLVGTLDAPTRITAPMIRKGWLDGRKGQRGKDSFVEVSWSDALSLVADELSRVKAEQGNQGIFAGCYGWASAGRPKSDSPLYELHWRPCEIGEHIQLCCSGGDYPPCSGRFPRLYL